jgi:tripartite-type tricarboxylate transporter receptor subunit TctC
LVGADLVWLIADAVPGYRLTGWLGFGVPKDTPLEIVERLNREVNTAMTNPTVKRAWPELGSDIFTGTPADFGRRVAEETKKWAKVVRFAGLKAD